MTSTEILQVESGQSIGRNCHRVVPIILYLIASWVILLAFLAYPGINAYGPSFFEDTISGQVL